MKAFSRKKIGLIEIEWGMGAYPADTPLWWTPMIPVCGIAYFLVVEEGLVRLLSDGRVERYGPEVLVPVFLLRPLNKLLRPPDQLLIHVHQRALVELPHVTPQLLQIIIAILGP